MDCDLEKVDDAVLGLLFLTLRDGRSARRRFIRDALSRLHEKGLVESPVSRNESVALTPAGRELAEKSAKAHFCTTASESWNTLDARPGVQYRSADGLKGMLCRSAVDGGYFFRIYKDEWCFDDYHLRHDDLSVQINNDAMAALYRGAGRSILDHSPEVLGIDGPNRRKQESSIP